MQFRKKPVVVEASFIDYDKKHVIEPEFRAALCTCDALPNEWPTKMHVHTLEGPLAVRDGDWLIKGVQGEFYPCKPDIFEATYVAISDEAPYGECACGLLMDANGCLGGH